MPNPKDIMDLLLSGKALPFILPGQATDRAIHTTVRDDKPSTSEIKHRQRRRKKNRIAKMSRRKNR